VVAIGSNFKAVCQNNKYRSYPRDPLRKETPAKKGRTICMPIPGGILGGFSFNRCLGEDTQRILVMVKVNDISSRQSHTLGSCVEITKRREMVGAEVDWPAGKRSTVQSGCMSHVMGAGTLVKYPLRRTSQTGTAGCLARRRDGRSWRRAGAAWTAGGPARVRAASPPHRSSRPGPSEAPTGLPSGARLTEPVGALPCCRRRRRDG